MKRDLYSEVSTRIIEEQCSLGPHRQSSGQLGFNLNVLVQLRSVGRGAFGRVVDGAPRMLKNAFPMR